MADPFESDGPGGYGFDEPPEKRRSPKPRALAALAVLVAVGGFAGVLLYAYNKGKEVGITAVPPIIKAGPAPHKVRPEKPGGMAFPDRDKDVYSRLAERSSGRGIERLLPPPETPIIPQAAGQPTETDPADATSASNARPELPPPPPVAVIPERPPVDTAVSSSAVPDRSRAAAQSSSPADAKAEPPGAAATAPTASRMAAIAPASGGNFKVQIASLRSEAAVRRSWGDLKRKHGDLLGRLELTVERRDLGSGKGVYYRLQAGPLASAAEAGKLCSSLKQRKLGCIVVRR